MSHNYVSGFDKNKKHLEEITKRDMDIHGKHDVPLKELLDSEFMRKHTNFNTLEEIINKSGLSIEKEQDLDKLKNIIVDNSTFKSWKELLKTASANWVQKKIGLNRKL